MGRLILLIISVLSGLILWIKQRWCVHEFNIEDIQWTHIKPLSEPETSDLKSWEQYFSELYTHPSVTRRVKCSCRKCGAMKYASAGISLPGTLTRAASAPRKTR